MLVYFWTAELRRRLSCLLSVSRLNVIFSKFDEVQRSGNMALSPVSGKITCPLVFTFVCFFHSARARFGLVVVVVATWFYFGKAYRRQHVMLKKMQIVFAHFYFQKVSKDWLPSRVARESPISKTEMIKFRLDKICCQFQDRKRTQSDPSSTT